MFKRVEPIHFLLVAVGIMACQAISVLVAFTSTMDQFTAISALPILGLLFFAKPVLLNKGLDNEISNIPVEKLRAYRTCNAAARILLLVGLSPLALLVFTDHTAIPMKLCIAILVAADAVALTGLWPCVLARQLARDGVGAARG